MFTVDGKWSEWSEYGFCTVTCGGGVQKRTRKCSSRNGGKECEGDAEMTRACNEQLCPGKQLSKDICLNIKI